MIYAENREKGKRHNHALNSRSYLLQVHVVSSRVLWFVSPDPGCYDLSLLPELVSLVLRPVSLDPGPYDLSLEFF